MLRPYKWLVIPVLQDVTDENSGDRNTDVIGERSVTRDGGQPLEVYGGIPGLIGFAKRFETEILKPLADE